MIHSGLEIENEWLIIGMWLLLWVITFVILMYMNYISEFVLYNLTFFINFNYTLNQWMC